ncbi:hypothetical protein HpKG114_15160 [Helicobacter pylori]
MSNIFTKLQSFSIRVLMNWRGRFMRGDADLVIGANNKIQEGLGQKALFGNKQECWEFITSRKEGWNFITSRGRTEI